MTHLGYLLPGLALVKEWAYAGLVFDITGGAVAHAAAGDGAPLLLVQLGCWRCWSSRRGPSAPRGAG